MFDEFMKYANYKMISKEVTNIGDYIQIMAIDYVYECMGIRKQDIVYIDKDETATYTGEPVILPVTMPLVDYYENGNATRFSDSIVPCYLGLTFLNTTLTELEVLHYKKYEPIGCRDEYTFNTLKKYKIDCYIHGCITQVFPERKNNNQDKVYIVDVNEQILKYIPDYIKENAVYKTHLYSDVIDGKKLAIEQYNEYKENARLVITSLLHCSVPCIAAGIPVVLIRDGVTWRMSWLEKIIPIYDVKYNNFLDFDWNPKSIDYSIHKQRLLNFTIKRLKDTYNKYSDILDLTWFYYNRNKSIYVNDACEDIKKYIDNNWCDKKSEYNYSIWGVTQISRWLVDYISENYPNAKLCHIYDTFRKVNFENISSLHPEEIVKYKDEIVFVTTSSASESAIDYFCKINKPADTYVVTRVKHRKNFYSERQ